MALFIECILDRQWRAIQQKVESISTSPQRFTENTLIQTQITAKLKEQLAHKNKIGELATTLHRDTRLSITWLTPIWLLFSLKGLS
jgi:hypothetical protein